MRWVFEVWNFDFIYPTLTRGWCNMKDQSKSTCWKVKCKFTYIHNVNQCKCKWFTQFTQVREASVKDFSLSIHGFTCKYFWQGKCKWARFWKRNYMGCIQYFIGRMFFRNFLHSQSVNHLGANTYLGVKKIYWIMRQM